MTWQGAWHIVSLNLVLATISNRKQFHRGRGAAEGLTARQARQEFDLEVTGRGCLPYPQLTCLCPTPDPTGQQGLTLTHLVTLNMENSSTPGMSVLTGTLEMTEF